MQTVRIDSRTRDHAIFGLSIEKYCSHDKLKSALAAILNLEESEVSIYSDGDSVDNYDDVVVVVVSYFEKGFKTYLGIRNRLHPENPLAIVRALCISLESPILIDAEDVPIWIMCTTDGYLSFVNAYEPDDEVDLIIDWSVSNPCKPIYRLNDLNFNLKQN